MKNIQTIPLNLVMFIALILTALNAEPDSTSGKISFFTGEVMIDRPTTSGQAIKAKIGMNISEGDTVKTGTESRCEITFNGNYVIRCDEKTMLLIELAKLAVSKLHSPDGKLWMNVKKLLRSEGITVSSPTAVCAIRGTIFSIEADSNAVKYSVYRGAIAVTPMDSKGQKQYTSLTVEKGNELTLVKDFNTYFRQNEKSFELYKNNQQAEFEKFQREQKRGADSLLNTQKEFVDRQIEHERSLFKPIGSYSYLLKPLDTSTTSDWITWNKKRDESVQW
jgi:FecR protein